MSSTKKQKTNDLAASVALITAGTAKYDAVIVCCTDDKQAEYWQTRLSETICKVSNDTSIWEHGAERSEERGERRSGARRASRLGAGRATFGSGESDVWERGERRCRAERAPFASFAPFADSCIAFHSLTFVTFSGATKQRQTVDVLPDCPRSDRGLVRWRRRERPRHPLRLQEGCRPRQRSL